MDFIEVNGVGLRYELSGRGDRTVVLIHEMGGSLESWDQVAPVLAAGRRVLRYDTRGAGLSEKVRGALSVDTMVDDLAALLDALQLTGKVALAGIAVGGAIALHAAARIPQRISAAIVGSPATGIAPDRRAAVLARVERIEREGMRVAVDELDGQRLSAGVAHRMRRALPPSAPAGSATTPQATPPSTACSRASTCRASLPASPARSWCSAAASTARARRRWSSQSPGLIPGARYQLLETSHYMAVVTPELIGATVREFLDTVSA